jgi:4'-phosphopantetheinyl transferase
LLAAHSQGHSPERVVLRWAALDVSPPLLRRLAASLSPAERLRAEQLGRDADRDRFVAARGWLRHLLAQQLGCTPSQVTLRTEEGEKPVIPGSRLCLSVARSHDVAVFATSSETELGVDLEAIRPGLDVDAIAARFFSPGEYRSLSALPPEDRQAAAYQCWTCKEAYGKAIGTGLTYPLAEVDVWRPGQAAMTVPPWSIHPVDLRPGFAAAVAVQGLPDWRPPRPSCLHGGAGLEP